MSSKICLVTGANGGIGRAVATALAGRDATLVLACRDRERGQAARAEIIAASGNQSVDVLQVDLSEQRSVRAMAAAFAAQYEQLDVLIHVAAVYKPSREATVDGLETMFAVNHLGPFLLTTLLLERLKAGVPSRVLVVTAPSTSSLDFDDLQAEKHFNALDVFGASKMANLLFAYEMARRLEGTGVAVNAVHPGLVKSNLMQQAPFIIRFISGLVSSAPEQAGSALARLALSDSYAGLSGRFFSGGKEIKSNAYSHDLQNQARLWDASLTLTDSR